ncbi:serine/threonine-protein kinase STY13-like [Oryza brachyantha]|uniref:Protein kinase domain-containing protein n=1 Tax=Oryza brachyantha TaxID=4533 RepID=J3N2R4_ORYBR|nr:serine/threonine-protein kinase STY13-like [Oryza brachyantha]
MEEEGYVRGDLLDLSSTDIQLDETMVGSSSSSNASGEVPTAPWQIDLSMLQIDDFIKQEPHAMMFHGKYDGCDVVVKLLEWGHVMPEQIVRLGESLRDVAAAWREMDHPSIAKLVGAFVGVSPPPGTTSFVLVEPLTGGTLKEYLIKNIECKLPYKKVVNFALAMARGLSYLHSRKIEHRNVKTDNMLLNDELNLKITDFGVACIESDLKDMTGQTDKLRYMAPEVLDGKPYNKKCDVYSFGICLWEIYCCEMPYKDVGSAEITSAVLHKQMRPKIPKCCPQDMACIMRRCWDAEPTSRPEMQDIVDMLEKLDTRKGRGMVPVRKPSYCFCFSIRRRGS